jgi:hypothetical protein
LKVLAVCSYVSQSSIFYDLDLTVK